MDETLTLRDVMRREFVGVTESDALEGALSLLAAEDATVALVVRGEEPVGTLTPQAVFTAVAEGDATGTEVGAVMGAAPPTLPPDVAVAEAVDLLADGGAAVVAVTDGSGVHGLVDAGDALSALAARPSREAPPEPGSVAAEAGAAADRDGYSRQSVCEACGSLAADLAEFNGQLLCADCRDV